MIFQERYFSCYTYSINWPSFISWLLLFLEIMDIMCIVIICCPVCDIKNFEINHGFLIEPVLLYKQNVWKIMQISQELKKLLTWNKKHFSSFSAFFIELNKKFFFGRSEPGWTNAHIKFAKRWLEDRDSHKKSCKSTSFLVLFNFMLFVDIDCAINYCLFRR